MRVRTSGNRSGANWRRKWCRSLALSFACHAIAFATIGLAVPGRTGSVDATTTIRPQTGDLADGPTLVDLAAIDTIFPVEPIPYLPVSPAPPLAPAVAGDRTNAVAESLSHPADGAKGAQAPAADRGAGAGRPVPEPAWRRDTSTLHERLADGADSNQPSHALTARAATSPQAVRREQRTGEGDSARTVRYRPEATAAQYGSAEPDEPGAGAATMSGTGTAVARVPSTATLLTRLDDAVVSSEGPLDSERGRRSFDVNNRGAVADDRSSRAASNEAHPAIMDLTLAAVSGNSPEGRGPSDTTGAVPSVTKGAAPAPIGVHTRSDDRGDEERTRERLHNRYRQQIRARVDQSLVWPRALAIRLLQGETILHFVVLPDGRLRDRVQVVKSSGFSEFDQAALDAVRKASPFPPMGDPEGARPLSVNLPVTFSNPVIR